MRLLLRTFRALLSHPLNRDDRVRALGRYVAWQIGTRLLPGTSVVVPWVDDAKLLVRRDMTNAMANVYLGLQAYEDMAFVLHLLRPGDTFVDVGANVGTYTVLASAVAGARTIAVEPVASTFEDLVGNVRINHLEDRVEALHAGIAAASGVRAFTADLGAKNRLVATGAGSPTDVPSETVDVRTLDELVGDTTPVCIKIDVEGFETEVVAGGENSLATLSPLAVIMETCGHGAQRGFDDDALHRRMLDFGLESYRYEPAGRELVPLHGAVDPSGDDTLYLRDADAIAARLRSAPSFRLRGRSY